MITVAVILGVVVLGSWIVYDRVKDRSPRCVHCGKRIQGAAYGLDGDCCCQYCADQKSSSGWEFR